MEKLRSHWLCAFVLLFLLAQVGVSLDSAALPVEHRSADFGGIPLPPDLGYSPSAVPPPQSLVDDPWPISRPDMPQISTINVQCEKKLMKVHIEFDRPFLGMIFSKGHYSDLGCVHLRPNLGVTYADFDIFLHSCGMTSSSSSPAYGDAPTPSGSYVENTIIIQYDPLVQEVWDQARRLRCTWYDYYEKAVTFRPFQVDMLNAITANFLGDNLQCWMQIQVGKGPWASEVSGIVKIGQTMTMVLAINDDENKFDMLVRNCVAHDGHRDPIQLVDEYGCVTRPKIMSPFKKIKNFGSSASVVSYAYFQAFKFPDSMNVHFQCVIQVCRYNCPEPKCGGGLDAGYGPPIIPSPIPPSYGPPLPSPTFPVPSPVPYGGLSPALLPPAIPDPRIPAGPHHAGPTPLPPFPPSLIPDYAPPRSDDGYIDVSASEKQPVPVVAPINLKEKTLVLPQPSSYVNINRDGVADVQSGYAIAKVGGRPRSTDGGKLHPNDLQGSRKRRDAPVLRIYKRDATDMTDIETGQTIQVVAPGDVAFNLNGGNETVVVTSLPGAEGNGSNICMSMPGFVAGLVMLLLVLVVALIVAAFLFIRVRSLNKKGTATTYLHGGYDNPEFVKVSNQQ